MTAQQPRPTIIRIATDDGVLYREALLGGITWWAIHDGVRSPPFPDERQARQWLEDRPRRNGPRTR
jgi:hypothetical protein